MELGDEQAMEPPESAIDRISSLPTEILHNILSLVQIRSVVRMRRLSKRWRLVCESLQFIRLSEQEFQSWSLDKFTRFVNNLLLLRAKVDLHAFQLHSCFCSSLNYNDVMLWISYAVKHNVKVLDLHLDVFDKHVLPRSVSTCPTLQELNLRHVNVPDTINLPSLRKLTLNDMIVSQLSLDQIIAQCPGLEDLNLRNCFAYFHLLDSKVLKSLTLYRLEVCLRKFTVAAPHLIYFECVGSPLKDISWRERPCLESAHIESCGHTFSSQPDFTGIILHAKRLVLLTDTDVKERRKYGGRAHGWERCRRTRCLEAGNSVISRQQTGPEETTTFVHGLTCQPNGDPFSYVRLTGGANHRSRSFLKQKVMLEKELPTCPVFENLEFLQIGGWCLTDSLYIILRFLQLSPRLHKLILTQRKLPEAEKGAGKDATASSEITFQCPHLQTVIIQCSKDDGEINTIVNAMVDNGVSLEKIHVSFYEDIINRCVGETTSNLLNQKRKFVTFEEQNPGWPHDSSYAGRGSDSNYDDW